MNTADGSVREKEERGEGRETFSIGNERERWNFTANEPGIEPVEGAGARRRS